MEVAAKKARDTEQARLATQEQARVEAEARAQQAQAHAHVLSLDYSAYNRSCNICRTHITAVHAWYDVPQGISLSTLPSPSASLHSLGPSLHPAYTLLVLSMHSNILPPGIPVAPAITTSARIVSVAYGYKQVSNATHMF